MLKHDPVEHNPAGQPAQELRIIGTYRHFTKS